MAAMAGGINVAAHTATRQQKLVLSFIAAVCAAERAAKRRAGAKLHAMDSDFYRKGFFVALLLLLGLALVKILVPFAGALSWGLCLAFLLSPLQRALTRRFRGRANLAAGLLTGLVPMVLLLPPVSHHELPSCNAPQPNIAEHAFSRGSTPHMSVV